MKKILRWILIVLGAVFLIVQFVRPAKNHSDEPQSRSISLTFPIPSAVDSILKRSCRDCHTNNTDYPWYAEVQPVGWWLQGHIDDGKSELNFDEFASYGLMRQFTKFQQIAEQIEEDEMPLPSYLIMHENARLTQDEKMILMDWATAMRDSMKNWYPADSLQRPRRRSP